MPVRRDRGAGCLVFGFAKTGACRATAACWVRLVSAACKFLPVATVYPFTVPCRKLALPSEATNSA